MLGGSTSLASENWQGNKVVGRDSSREEEMVFLWVWVQIEEADQLVAVQVHHMQPPQPAQRHGRQQMNDHWRGKSFQSFILDK